MKRTNFISQRFPGLHLKIENLRVSDAGFEEICTDYEEMARMLEQTETHETGSDNNLKRDIQSTITALEEEITKGLKCTK